MGPAAKKILRALDRRANNIEVPVRTVAPTRSTASLGQSLVVDLSENRLYLYDALKVVRSYPVATAADGYVTLGTWEIVDKRENPTWYNPALDTWGADLPAVIPPGPGNPLGTRALYLNAPASGSTARTARIRSGPTPHTAAYGCSSRTRELYLSSWTWGPGSSSSRNLRLGRPPPSPQRIPWPASSDGRPTDRTARRDPEI